jgi:transcriptional regulator with XRE-family HTH domain
MRDATDAFARKFSIALKALNLSRVQVAALVEVDKSAVGRWLRATTQPSDYNLARLSDALAERHPGFTRADWELPVEAFTRKLSGARDSIHVPSGMGRASAGKSRPGDTGAVPDPYGDLARLGPALRSFAAFRDVIDREAAIYEGFYIGYNMSSVARGKLVARAVRARRIADRLRVEAVGADFPASGEAFILRGRAYILGELDGLEGFGLTLLNATGRATPDVMVGISLYVGFDSRLSPSATPAAFEFRGRFSGDAARDEARWQELIAYARSVPTEAGLATVRPEIRRVLEARVTLPSLSDDVDWVMRVPADLNVG